MDTLVPEEKLRTANLLPNINRTRFMALAQKYSQG